LFKDVLRRKLDDHIRVAVADADENVGTGWSRLEIEEVKVESE